MLEVHTEKGSDAERITRFLMDHGVETRRLVLCHMDKRCDFSLHRDLAQQGVLLEYDTIFRTKYNPEVNVWPLICRMATDGLDAHIALGSDLAEPKLWRTMGEDPGLAGLMTRVRPRLEELGIQDQSIQGLLGGNIARRLAGAS